MGKHRILYFSLDGDTTVVDDYLRAKGADNEIEVVGVKQPERWCAPTPEQLVGIDGVIGDSMPVDAATARMFGEAGVRITSAMSIGYDHLDVDALRENGVLACNCPGYCSEEVAMHAVALMMDVLRKVTLLDRDVRGGGWDYKLGYPIRRISNMTLGLVFFGSIARRVAPVAQAMGMRVVAWAPHGKADEMAALGVEKVEELDELLRRSDVVSLHCPLVDVTRDLIDAHALSAMSPGAMLINTARGECVDEEALLAALDEYETSGGARGIAAAGLDVLRHEEADPNPALIAHPRCVVTPHSGWDSVESYVQLRQMAIEPIREYLLTGRIPSTCVNPPLA